jgi:hypothetical protein
MSKPFALTIAACLLLVACGPDNGDHLLDAGALSDADLPMTDGGGGGGGDAMNVTCDTTPHFSSIYSVILGRATGPGACALAGCHGSPPGSSGLEMDRGKDMAYTALLMGGTSDAQAKTAFPSRVKAGDPTHSFLYLKVSEAMPPGSFGTRMPLGGNPLPQCEIDAIAMWITQGAMND